MLNGKFVVLYIKVGRVYVINSIFEENLSEYDFKFKILLKYVEWCGKDVVVIVWEDEVYFVGLYGLLVKFYYDSGCVYLLFGE